MGKIEKGLGILMWATVGLLIIIAFATIIIGHATNFAFFFGFQDVPELSKTIISNNSAIL